MSREPGGAGREGASRPPKAHRSSSEAGRVRADQDHRIHQLESTLRAVQDRLDGSAESLAESSSESPGEDSEREGVDRKYVDERIQDFENATTSRFLISGYGTTGLTGTTGKDGDTAFAVSFNPGFHFRMADELHRNAALEMEYEENSDDSMEFELYFDLGIFY